MFKVAHLGDKNILGLDIPVEAVVLVAEVDRLRHHKYVP
jgi:hypothetical protein